MESPATATLPTLAVEILNRLESLLRDAEKQTKPLEVDPLRGQLFELFVTAQGAGYLDDNAETDLTADVLCRRLAERLGLRDAATASVARQTRLPEQHLAKMRLLWSLMRMWMEWTYAWSRWQEFHNSEPRT